MNKGRKRVIGIIAGILVALHLRERGVNTVDERIRGKPADNSLIAT